MRRDAISFQRVAQREKKNEKKKIFEQLGCQREQKPDVYIYFEKNHLKFVLDPKNSTRRQNFKNVYFISGAAYIIKTSLLKNQKNFVNSESKIYELSDCSMIDIDLPFHLNLARGYNYITDNDS